MSDVILDKYLDDYVKIEFFHNKTAEDYYRHKNNLKKDDPLFSEKEKASVEKSLGFAFYRFNRSVCDAWHPMNDVVIKLLTKMIDIATWMISPNWRR